MKILVDRKSEFQHVQLCEDGDHVYLTHDGGLQFHTADEGRHHEVMTTLPLLLATQARRVLVLGGGDGLAVREALRFAEVEQVTLVELDPVILEVTREHPAMRRITGRALDDPRVRVIQADAFARHRARGVGSAEVSSACHRHPEPRNPNVLTAKGPFRPLEFSLIERRV